MLKGLRVSQVLLLADCFAAFKNAPYCYCKYGAVNQHSRQVSNMPRRYKTLPHLVQGSRSRLLHASDGRDFGTIITSTADNTIVPSLGQIDAVVLLPTFLNRIRDGFDTNSRIHTGILAVPISSNLQETKESRQKAGPSCAGREAKV